MEYPRGFVSIHCCAGLADKLRPAFRGHPEVADVKDAGLGEAGAILALPRASRAFETRSFGRLISIVVPNSPGSVRVAPCSHVKGGNHDPISVGGRL
jgi:hypothetical protein